MQSVPGLDTGLLIGLQLASQGFNLHDLFWGRKTGGDPVGGRSSRPAKRPQRIACATNDFSTSIQAPGDFVIGESLRRIEDSSSAFFERALSRHTQDNAQEGCPSQYVSCIYEKQYLG